MNTDEAAKYLQTAVSESLKAFSSKGCLSPTPDEIATTFGQHLKSMMSKHALAIAEAGRPTEYDPVTCVTAGELRALGAEIPDAVPDCGWVSRAALLYDNSPEVTVEGSRMSIHMSATIDEPFKWINVTVDISK
jgi:hypothetical protein